jgi:malonyl-CoA/methylmalonyl-CoA synthetase
MHLIEQFRPSLEDAEDTQGLEFGRDTYCFGEIETRANALANKLFEDGLRKGDRFCCYLPNCVELIDLYLACLKLGIIFVPINVLYRGREIRHILRDARPRGIATDFHLADHIKPVIPPGSNVYYYEAHQFRGLTRDARIELPSVEADASTPAALVYTSGTTGRSKGAILSHENFAANARNLIEAWKITADDRLLLPLPLFHVHGLGNGLHTWLMRGYRMRLLERFYKEEIADEFFAFRPTVFFGVPTMYERLLSVPPEKAREIGGFMRLFVSGSAPLPAQTLERFHELFGHVILERYGMSETLMNISNPYDGERRAGSVGKPLPKVEVRLIDPSAGTEVRDGETGEILLKGPNVFSGYWKNPEADKQAFTADGWFRSGDLASRSADGYYTLHGRRSELIISGGFNIYPREIEEFLTEREEVSEAAVVGRPDEVRGEVPVAYVTAEFGCTIDPKALEKSCRENLASFKVPREFIEVEVMPRNAMGKIEKYRLAAEPERKPEWPAGTPCRPRGSGKPN